jgi:hypothetical protein
MKAKPLSKLTARDLARFPVWEFDNGSETLRRRDESWVVPVVDLPDTNLSNRVVSVTLQFGRREALGILGNVDLDDVLATREFATLSVRRGRSWFHLLRYFDPGYEQRGPQMLAEFMEIPLSDAFPIRYDISGAAVGHPQVVRGRINAEPETRLSESERLNLILERLRHRGT